MHCKGSERRPEIMACEHSLLCNLQMQGQSVSCKEEATCERDPEMPWSSRGKAQLKWTEAKWKTIQWSDE